MTHANIELSGKYVEDVTVGEVLPQLDIGLTVYRLVMAAGSNRDFNSIHHNTEYAQSTGAKEMYANTSFLLTSWERLVREWIGETGRFVSITGFRMRSFNYVGDTLIVKGEVESVEGNQVAIKVWCENAQGVSVGPGTVRVALPSRKEA